MERGHNYFDLSESEKRLFSSSPSHPCVFISHKKEDADFARHLSDYVMERGINVYFDENDPILAKEHKSPDEVVKAIKIGLEKSTHMIIVLSKNTLESNWVPWEVGFASAKDKEYREGEFVSDSPYCLDGDVSEVSIEADMPCEVCVISGQELQALFDNDPKMAKMDVKILKNLFKMVYARDLDHYRYTARSRYRRLLERCPQVVQMLSLKDIASFLNITPSYLSTLRKEMTFGQK